MSSQQPPGPDAPGRAEWLWVGTGILAVVLALLCGEAARGADGALRGAAVGGQAVFTAAAFAVPQLRGWRAARAEANAEEREIEARVETRIAINDALDPVLRLLGRLSADPTPTARERIAAQAVTLVLATASEFIGPERARACWFRFEPGPPTRLLPAEHAGRAGPPTTVFTAGTTAGDAAIDLVLGRGSLRCVDVESDPPPGWSLDRRPDYRTFVAVPVADEEVVFGMLTLDALTAGTLTPDDLGLLQMMAGLLALPLGLRMGHTENLDDGGGHGDQG